MTQRVKWKTTVAGELTANMLPSQEHASASQSQQLLPIFSTELFNPLRRFDVIST